MDLVTKPRTYEWQGRQYIVFHGDAFDRGSADSYYGRAPNPHKYPNGTGNAPRVEELTEMERAEYHAGYDYNEAYGDKKDWG